MATVSPLNANSDVNEAELAAKLKNLTARFEQDFAVLEKSFFEIRKELQTSLDKNKLKKVKQSFGNNK